MYSNINPENNIISNKEIYSYAPSNNANINYNSNNQNYKNLPNMTLADSSYSTIKRSSSIKYYKNYNINNNTNVNSIVNIDSVCQLVQNNSSMKVYNNIQSLIPNTNSSPSNDFSASIITKDNLVTGANNSMSYNLQNPIRNYSMYFSVIRPEFSNYNYSFGSRKKTFSYKNIEKTLDLLNFEELECPIHSEIKEYFLLENIDNSEFKIHDLICKNCLMNINYQKIANRNYSCDNFSTGEFKSKHWHSLLLENQNKMRQIMSNEFNTNYMINISEISDLIRTNILRLAEELKYLTENFLADICDKIAGNCTGIDNINKLKVFIAENDLLKSEPNLLGIGKNLEMKRKYIKLAKFLMQTTTRGNTISNSGISAKLKSHIDSVLNLRHLINLRIHEWISFLTGEFYTHIFNIEGSIKDEDFLHKIQSCIRNYDSIRNNKSDFYSHNNMKSFGIFKTDVEKKIEILNCQWEEKMSYNIAQVNQKHEAILDEQLRKNNALNRKISELQAQFDNEKSYFQTQTQQYKLKEKEFYHQLVNYQKAATSSNPDGQQVKEIIKEIKVPYPVETIREKIVEKPVIQYIDREVIIKQSPEIQIEYIEKPVEIIKEVNKIEFIEKIVEKPIEIIKIVEKLQENQLQNSKIIVQGENENKKEIDGNSSSLKDNKTIKKYEDEIEIWKKRYNEVKHNFDTLLKRLNQSVKINLEAKNAIIELEDQLEKITRNNYGISKSFINYDIYEDDQKIYKKENVEEPQHESDNLLVKSQDIKDNYKLADVITQNIKNTLNNSKNLNYTSKKDLIKNAENEVKSIYSELDRVKAKLNAAKNIRGNASIYESNNVNFNNSKTMKIFVDGKMLSNSTVGEEFNMKNTNNSFVINKLAELNLSESTMHFPNSSICLNTEIVNPLSQEPESYDYNYYTNNIKKTANKNYENSQIENSNDNNHSQ